MGQRHQLFVIAKINGRYRTLCAIHHQWLYGHTALRRCLGTLKIFRDPANRIPLQQEFIAAQRHDEAFWAATEGDYYQKNSHVPFPFIATCLITGASFSADEGYYHNVSVEPFYMAFDQGDNNNGITIFDITELSNVRYCFVDYHGMESERPVQLMTPLTAHVYLGAYYDLGDSEAEDLLSLLDEFKEWDTISVATLEDTWPEGEWEEPESNQGDREEMADSNLEKGEISTSENSKSLRDGAMVTLIQALSDASDDAAGLLPEAELLTDLLPKMKRRLYERASALKPSPYLLDLLFRTLEEDVDVDLSPFKHFSAEDMSLVVSRLRKHGKMHTLCISNRPDITAEDLQVVLSGADSLKALYILEDPQIPAQGMSLDLKDCDLYNSDLLRQAIKPEPIRSFSDSPRSNSTVPTIQVYGENDISQLVWIGVTDRQALDKSFRLKSGLIDWGSLQQEKRRTNFGWSGTELRYKRYSIDIPLPTFRTVAGLLCLLEWSSSSRLSNFDDFSSGAACSFAMAPSIPPGGNGLGIGPLAAGLYRGNPFEITPASDSFEHLESGRWAIVLIHEAYNAMSQKYLDPPEKNEKNEKNEKPPFRAIKRLRYALVTPCAESHPSVREFIVADIPTWLEHTKGKMQEQGSEGESQKLAEVWNRRIATIDTVDFYEDEDIHDILPKVFPGQNIATSSSKPE